MDTEFHWIFTIFHKWRSFDDRCILICLVLSSGQLQELRIYTHAHESWEHIYYLGWIFFWKTHFDTNNFIFSKTKCPRFMDHEINFKFILRHLKIILKHFEIISLDLTWRWPLGSNLFSFMALFPWIDIFTIIFRVQKGAENKKKIISSWIFSQK